MKEVKKINMPISQEQVNELEVGDFIELTGYIFTGRDAALPKLVELIEKDALEDLNLEGSAIFHTAVSAAGIGPTSSNKFEIESSIPALSKAGVKIHIGKGELRSTTIDELKRNGSIYAITPPLSALLTSKAKSIEVVAFPDEGIEALHKLYVENFPIVIAAAHGRIMKDC